MAMSYSSVLGWEEWEVDTASFWEKKKNNTQNQLSEIKTEKETTK